LLPSGQGGSFGLNRDRSLRSRFSRQSAMLYGGGETRRGTTEHEPALREDEKKKEHR
jgi:hypothetical protein